MAAQTGEVSVSFYYIRPCRGDRAATSRLNPEGISRYGTNNASISKRSALHFAVLTEGEMISSRWISCCGIACLCLLSHEGISAATLVVDAATPYVAADGLCSLTEAIDNANADSLVHADCPAGLGDDTIELTANLVLDGTQIFAANGPNGLPSITSTITLAGSGYSLSRDPAADSFRLLHVAAGGDLSVNRLDAANGLVDTGFDNGGGIYNLGVLTVAESTLRNCRVASIFPSGGGIYNEGHLTILNSTLSGNEAADDTFSSGGAVYSALGSMLHATNVRFEHNVANQAGAVFAGGDGTIIQNSQFIDNEGRESAGALLLFNNLGGNSHAVFNSLFENNHAAGNGGAIASGSKSAELFGNEFRNNAVTQSGAGGAIFNSGGDMVITASRFETNRAEATAVGGALANVALGTISLAGSVLDSNESATLGGGFYTVLAPVFIRDSLIIGNTAATGGGLYQAGSNVDGYLVHRSAFIGNSASVGGGAVAAVGNQTVARIFNSTIAENTAFSFGGGIFLNGGGRVDITHTAVVANDSTEFINSVGGFSAFAGTTVIDSSIIAYNIQEDCSATNNSSSLGFNITTGPAGGIPPDRWCSFIPLQATDLTATDPLLAPLAANGNIGPSRLLAEGSPAEAAIPGGCPAELEGVDQRGVPRPEGACDIGPVSRNSADLPLVAFAEAGSEIDTEGSAVVPHIVNLVVDNTAGNLDAPSPSLPLSLHVRITGSAAMMKDYSTGLAIPTVLVVDAGNWPAPGASAVLPLDFSVIDDDLAEGNETIELAVLLTGPGLLGAQSTHTITIIDDDSAAIACRGFYPPLQRHRFISRPSQGVIPVKLELIDAAGNFLTDANLAAPPRVRVVDPGEESFGAQPRENHDLIPVGNSNAINAFAFNAAEQLWEYRLDTSQFPDAGTYEISIYSGDLEEYQIDTAEQCYQRFTRR